MLLIILIVLVLAICYCLWKKSKQPVKETITNNIDNSFEYITIAENKDVNLDIPINNEIKASLNTIEKTIQGNHNINDTFYKLNKVMSKKANKTNT